MSGVYDKIIRWAPVVVLNYDSDHSREYSQKDWEYSVTFIFFVFFFRCNNEVQKKKKINK